MENFPFNNHDPTDFVSYLAVMTAIGAIALYLGADDGVSFFYIAGQGIVFFLVIAAALYGYAEWTRKS